MVKKKIEDLYRDKPLYPDQSIKLTLPLPPSVNHMYVMRGGHQRTLSAKAKKYVQDAQQLCASAMKEHEWQKDRDHVWYYMDLVFYFPDRIIRDSHNMLKLLTDIFQGMLYKNDYHVMPRIQHVGYDAENPRLEMTLTNQ